jgi:2-amino-4-hydroxy-6-hydroxymethyldihydropteridine diphosphokinase
VTFTAVKRIIFGIGSNLGDRESYLDSAVTELERELFLSNSRKSKIFRNPAMLLPNSPAEWDVEFFNIAFSANIDSQKFSPEKILEIVKKIEKNLGRKERKKWSPREIDIDILAIGNLRINLGKKLTVPHPGLLERDFFIQTVREIEPGFSFLNPNPSWD